MQTISKKIRFSNYLLILLMVVVASPTVAANLILSSAQGQRVSVNVKNKHVIAKDKEKNITYNVDSSLSRYLTRAEDIRLISNENRPQEELFIVLTRESSQPGAMGQGYCGAGYEDYLLLVEILERKLLLRDKFLLQSCLKNISMFIDRGEDDPSNGLIHEKDGSFIYRLVDDDYEKKRVLTISGQHFKINLVPAPNQ